jgi:hypothetical protein
MRRACWTIVVLSLATSILAAEQPCSVRIVLVDPFGGSVRENVKIKSVLSYEKREVKHLFEGLYAQRIPCGVYRFHLQLEHFAMPVHHTHTVAQRESVVVIQTGAIEPRIDRIGPTPPWQGRIEPPPPSDGFTWVKFAAWGSDDQATVAVNRTGQFSIVLPSEGVYLVAVMQDGVLLGTGHVRAERERNYLNVRWNPRVAPIENK